MDCNDFGVEFLLMKRTMMRITAYLYYVILLFQTFTSCRIKKCAMNCCLEDERIIPILFCAR